MADIFEVRGYPRAARGTLCPVEVYDDRLVFAYDGLDGRRRTTTVTLDKARIEPVDDPDAWPGATVIARWRSRLKPGRKLTIEWTVGYATEPSGSTPPPVRPAAAEAALTPSASPSAPARTRRSKRRPELPFVVPHVDSDHELLDRTLVRSIADLAALRNDGPLAGEHYLAAGIPWFATLFGRDSIIAALETAAFIPSFAVATLDVLARLQATTDDPWHDAEPGKILHEMRTGEMARAGETPHDAYYGSVDSTPLWLILLGEAHAWTGDDRMLERLWPNALAALDWIDESGDLDGDGFVEYRRRSKLGLLNQGWKDSGDAIRHTDGQPADGPIALAEVQGYVYAAKRAMARLARHRGEMELAARLDTAADVLRDRFDEAFWMPGARFYAMALDGEKRQVESIGSNAGQALWSGIVPTARAARVAERILEPDMFSGWGVRTFASGQPGYNPVGYHTGSIWPHDNALIAAGLKASGATDGANLLAGRLIESAQWFPDLRLPELFCGFTAGRRRGAGGLSGRLLAAGLGRRRAVLPAPHDARPARRRVGPSPRAHPPEPARLARQDHHHRACRSASDSVDLLVHRWRGGTSAEVLGRRGSIDVIIHV